MRISGPFLPLVAAAVLALTAGSARAGFWKVGRDSTDCPGGCNFFDKKNGSAFGDGIKIAVSSPSVISGDTVMVWRGNRTAGGVLDYPGRITMKSGVKLIGFGYPDSMPKISSVAGGIAGITMNGCSEVTEINGFIITWDAQLGGLGGGMAAYTSAGTVRNCAFVNCNAGVGAGIYMQICDMTIDNNVFLNNTCGAGGGVVAISGGTPILTNNTFYGSTAPSGTEGAAVYATGTDFVLQKNIIYGSLGASAVFCGGGNMPVIECNLFWANQLGTYGGQCPDSTGTSGNIIADPLFCDPSMLNFGVCSDSPALGGACGPIGFVSPFGNCPSCKPTGVEAVLKESSWGRVKAGYR